MDESELSKYKIKISKVELGNDYLTIISDNGNEFKSPIKKGSIECRIYNESNQEVSLGNLEENSLVTILGTTNNKNKLSDNQKLYNYLTNNLVNEPNKSENREKNIIVIRKIIVKNNWVFNSDSSEHSDNYD